MNSGMTPFDISHLDGFEMRPSEAERLALDPGARMKLEALAKYGDGGTLFRNGVAIGILGFYEMWPGVFEVWAFPSVHVERYPMLYLRTAKRYIALIETTFKPHRLQTTSIADDLHDRWMEFLGFHCEGNLEKYSVNQQDYRMWAKLYGTKPSNGNGGEPGQ